MTTSEKKKYIYETALPILKDKKESLLLASKLSRCSRAKGISELKKLFDYGSRSLTKFEYDGEEYAFDGDILATNAIGHYVTVDVERGNLFTRHGYLHATCLKEPEDRYRAIVQYQDGQVYILVVEVRQDQRGKGLMVEAFELVRRFAFDFHQVGRIIARADPPRISLYTGTEDRHDWRTEVSESTGNSRLYDKWLSFPNSYRIDGYGGKDKDNAFCILNPDIIKQQDPNQYLINCGYINVTNN